MKSQEVPEGGNLYNFCSQIEFFVEYFTHDLQAYPKIYKMPCK